MAELTPLHKPEDVAKALGCSGWWVREQARRGLIPFTKAGGAYRFTDAHYAEIVRIYEKTPDQAPQKTERGQGVRRRAQVEADPVVQLQARRPRRTRAG